MRARNNDVLELKPSRWKVFLMRLLSTLFLWAVVLSPVFFHSYPAGDYLFVFLLLLLAVLGLREFYQIASRGGVQCFSWLGYVFGVLLLGSTFFYLNHYWGKGAVVSRANDFEAAILILFVLGITIRQLFSQDNSHGLISIAATLLGLFYVPWLLNFIQKIYFFTGVSGILYVLFFILVTKFSDMGAYLTGSLIGKHKVIPRISPGKTWEGIAGAVLFSTLGSVGFLYLSGGRMPEMRVVDAVVLGVVLSLTAVVGDLIESCFKRQSGLKDSGAFFPGIGGVLDLLDSILFNAPIMYLYLRYVLT